MLRNIAFAILAAMMPACVFAQAAAGIADIEARFDRASQARTLKVYFCPGSTGSGGRERPDLVKLRTALNAMAKTGANENAIAKTLKCELYSDKIAVFSITKILGPTAKGIAAEWLIGDLAMSHPGATGYNFYGIARVPPASQGVNPAARADADFMKVFGQRSMAAAGDENGGYYICPSAIAASGVISVLGRMPEEERDQDAPLRLVGEGCREGRGAVTNVRAVRVLGKDYTHWYSGTGMQGGKTVDIVMWASN